MSLEIIASETSSWPFSTGEPGTLEGDKSQCRKVSGRGPGDLFLQSQTLPSVQNLMFLSVLTMEKSRQPIELLREGTMSSFSTGLEGLTNGGDLGMETTLLSIPKQGCFRLPAAGSSLSSWTHCPLLSPEPGQRLGGEEEHKSPVTSSSAGYVCRHWLLYPIITFSHFLI